MLTQHSDMKCLQKPRLSGTMCACGVQAPAKAPVIILPEAVTAAATTYLRCGEQPASSSPLAAECSATDPSMATANTPSSALHTGCRELLQHFVHMNEAVFTSRDETFSTAACQMASGRGVRQHGGVISSHWWQVSPRFLGWQQSKSQHAGGGGLCSPRHLSVQ